MHDNKRALLYHKWVETLDKKDWQQFVASFGSSLNKYLTYVDFIAPLKRRGIPPEDIADQLNVRDGGGWTARKVIGANYVVTNKR